MTLKNQWLKKPHISTEEMANLYQQGLSATQIAERLGLAKTSVSRRLKKVGVKLRSNKEYEGKNRYWLWKGDMYLNPLSRRRNQRKLRKWSLAIRKRDNNTCQDCREKSRILHAHHIIPLQDCLDLPLEFDISNGITLCPKCHGKRHKLSNEKRKTLA